MGQQNSCKTLIGVHEMRYVDKCVVHMHEQCVCVCVHRYMCI